MLNINSSPFQIIFPTSHISKRVVLYICQYQLVSIIRQLLGAAFGIANQVFDSFDQLWTTMETATQKDVIMSKQ